ncbi:MAG: lipid-A-disaccharide synthase [Cyanobacteria bacterium P01_D01_bin.128]
MSAPPNSPVSAPVNVPANDSDIVILSNGPGEIMTWVKPVVRELRQQLGDRPRISVILSPCPHASGKEAAIAQSYPEVDRVQAAECFWPFLLRGKTAENWDWRDRGTVIFLGGDQLYPILIGKRLGYKTLIYAEWDARWLAWGDRYGVMNPSVTAKVPKRYQHKLTVVGDLMCDVSAGHQPKDLPAPLSHSPTNDLIALMPGSKPNKLQPGVPLVCAVANYLHYHRPSVRCVIPVAPGLSLPALQRFSDANHNPVVPLMNGPATELVIPPNSASLPYLATEAGAKIYLWRSFPAYDLLSHCRLCLTTIGANTAELGALGIPMMVLLPTQHITAMRSWDGLLGIAANLPGVGLPLTKLINRQAIRWIQKTGKRFAWPNLWAKREIVPELLGALSASDLGQQVIDYLDHPEQLERIRRDLRAVRGDAGAARQLVALIAD